MATIKKNESVKAFTSHLSKNNRKEWEMACNTNPNRGKVYDQWELLNMFDRDCGDANGASKTVHILDDLVVKRHQTCGYIPERRNARGTGNQLIDEAKFYEAVALLPEADLLCPVLKYFTSKSDKVAATSEKMQHNVVIIAQKAVRIGSASYACRKAEELNNRYGHKGESASDRFRKLEKLSASQNWRDAIHNGGNSGVIFDYAKGCYKAVFVDYAL